MNTTETTLSSSTVTALRGHDQLVAVNQDEGTVSVVHVPTEEVTTVAVGREPTRVAADRDRFWVTLRLDNEVVAVERVAGAWTVTERVTVGSEPYGIVFSGDGSRLYVALSMDDSVVELDADSLAVVRTFPVPGEPRWLALHPTGASLAVATARGGRVVLLGGLLGDVVTTEEVDYRLQLGSTAVRASGDPSFSVDGSMLAVPLAEVRDPTGTTSSGYYVGPAGIVQASVATIEVSRADGAPTGELLTLLTRIPSVPTHTSVVGDSRDIYVTLEGHRDSLRLHRDGTRVRRSATGWGPGGVAVDDAGDVWVHSTFDLTLARTWAPSSPVVLTTSALPEDVRRGRDLFYSAEDPGMTSGGASCGTCHAEGRSDGFTWRLETGRWQTPSLAGDVDATAPVSWAQDVASVSDEAIATVTGPMAGTGKIDVSALSAYVRSVRLPNPPTITASPEVLELGERAFLRAGCATCHAPPLYTNNLSHAMFGMDSVQTPTLLGIAGSAPYLHNGVPQTLTDVLQASVGQMGEPEVLSADETQALVAWLRTL